MTQCDIAVIGGGPEAMAAVSHLAWRNTPNVIWIAPDDPLEADRHRDATRWGLSRSGETATAVEFEELRKKIDIRIGATAWGAFPGFEVAVHSGNGSELVKAKRLILCTGATEIARSFPGSDLPGVMTGDGLLRMLVHQQVWPGGRRVAIVGDDEELAATVRAAIEMFDGEVVAQTHEPPVVHARDGVTASIQIGAEPPKEADIVAICAGQQPDIALALMLECATGFSDALGGFVPVRSAEMETSVAGVYVCGAGAGIGSRDAYTGEGVIAAEAAARSLDSDKATVASSAGFDERRLAWEAQHRSRLDAAASVAAEWKQHAITSVRATAGVPR